ncbi:Hypothetical predicted protein [Marmota monax]|uniref:Uncharacterized protein n=1 Tax=Marmota monax TaxID=9995 RepID=A0A5E4AU07_MARMO|nr:Hypothetical predicted protein [Marmota monax]
MSGEGLQGPALKARKKKGHTAILPRPSAHFHMSSPARLSRVSWPSDGEAGPTQATSPCPPQYLLSMVVEYFGRVGLPGHLYNRVHFFLALYIASDMEEDNPTPKRSIFQFLLGEEHWPDFYKEFLKLKVEFFHAMGHQAWVTPELCEEIQAQNPHHWVWSRVRQCAP